MVVSVGMYGQMNAVASGIVEGLDEDGVSEVLGGVGSVGLDKNWDVVLRMLDASAPVSMMSQMRTVGSRSEYGAAVIPAEVVAEVAPWIVDLGIEAVGEMFDRLDLDDAYPGVWDEPSAREGALEVFIETRDLFVRAAAAGDAVLFGVE